jgi:small multidrug resistance family-3 protein
VGRGRHRRARRVRVRRHLAADSHFGRILAAYGGIFVAGSLAWGMALDGFKPDRYDITGSVICLLGVAVIMYAPRGN